MKVMKEVVRKIDWGCWQSLSALLVLSFPRLESAALVAMTFNPTKSNGLRKS